MNSDGLKDLIRFCVSGKFQKIGDILEIPGEFLIDYKTKDIINKIKEITGEENE